MSPVEDLKHDLKGAERQPLEQLRLPRRGLRAEGVAVKGPAELTFGRRVADTAPAIMGSWKFIIVQTTILLVWIVLNITRNAPARG